MRCANSYFFFLPLTVKVVPTNSSPYPWLDDGLSQFQHVSVFMTCFQNRVSSGVVVLCAAEDFPAHCGEQKRRSRCDGLVENGFPQKAHGRVTGMCLSP